MVDTTLNVTLLLEKNSLFVFIRGWTQSLYHCIGYNDTRFILNNNICNNTQTRICNMASLDSRVN